jgi:hypothetical protein
MTDNSQVEIAVDRGALREEVKSKYREVATDPHGTFHFHTGRIWHNGSDMMTTLSNRSQTWPWSHSPA